MTDLTEAAERRAALLTSAEMGQADRLAVEHGVPSLTLMEHAGRALADAVLHAREPGKVLVLAGPGNNGGDGYVAARYLDDAGWRVSISTLRDPSELDGDAAEMARRWNGPVRKASPDHLDGQDVVIDAMLATGLTGPLQGATAELVEAVNRSGAYVVAADLPTGLDGDTGQIHGQAVMAHETVTFFRPKLGHVLMPGKALCGRLHVVDIGIPDRVLDTIRPRLFHNTPALWGDVLPRPDWRDHKYDRGAVLVISGGSNHTGAPRLAARGALRSGAGLVTMLCPPSAAMIHAAHLTAIMLQTFEAPDHLTRIVEERKAKAVVLGPAVGVQERTKQMALTLLKTDLGVVLDADALTVFADAPKDLIQAANERTILTPHEGEFERLFPGLLQSSPNRIEATREAARGSGTTVLLKGANTVIADREGKTVAIASNAPATLATAGAGDVLSGMIAGLLAQGMAPFQAACAAAWMHGEAASVFGPGLIAEDLPEMLPEVLTRLEEDHLGPAPLILS